MSDKSKSANAYCSEIEILTKSLENAYITDGLTNEVANKYFTQVAVKAMTKNCTIDKVKFIMEAGQFNSMNDAISKFVGSCTEATGQQNTILHFGQKTFNNQNHGNRRRFQRRNNCSRNYNSNFSNNNRNCYDRNFNNNNNANLTVDADKTDTLPIVVTEIASELQIRTKIVRKSRTVP